MVASVPFLERLMPGISRPGGVRPALPPRFTPEQPAEVHAESLPSGQVEERAAAEGEKLTAHHESRAEEASSLRPPQRDEGVQPPGLASPPAISPILASQGPGEPQRPAPARETTRSLHPRAPAPVVRGQPVHHSQQGPNPREHPDAS